MTAFRARVNLGGALYDFDPGAGLRMSRENLAASRRLGRLDVTVAYNAACRPRGVATGIGRSRR